MIRLDIILAIIFGLVFGSFLSVIVFRLDAKEGIVTGRSECRRCLKRLKWYDLVPLLSFLYLKGKCRYCKVKIGVIYPIMELAVAATFVSYCSLNGTCVYISSFYHLSILFTLLALLFFDYSFYILPDKLIGTGFIISLLYFLLFNSDLLNNSLIIGLALGSFFAILYLASKGKWLGFGDAKLAFLVGFVLGYPAGVFAVMASVWAGALWGIGLILLNRANLKTPLPFGSFMAGATILFIIFQNYEIWFRF